MPIAKFTAALALFGSLLVARDVFATEGARSRERQTVGSIEINPLPVAYGRLSLNAEWAPAAHHALIGSFGYQLKDGDFYSGVSGELGYRWYSGTTGLTGFFAGASALFTSLSYKPDQGGTQPPRATATMAGGAIDGGYQYVTGHFLVSGGLGVLVQSVDKPYPVNGEHPEIIFFAGVLPRVTFALGYAF